MLYIGLYVVIIITIMNEYD